MVEIRPNDVLLSDIFVVCMDGIVFEKFAKVKKVLQLAPVSPIIYEQEHSKSADLFGQGSLLHAQIPNLESQHGDPDHPKV